MNEEENAANTPSLNEYLKSLGVDFDIDLDKCAPVVRDAEIAFQLEMLERYNQHVKNLTEEKDVSTE